MKMPLKFALHRNSRRRRSPLLCERLERRVLLDSTVVFNEVMYHPATTGTQVEGDYEWVELYNQMSINMDISGWKLQGAVSYTFPSAPNPDGTVGTIVPAHGYLVIAANPSVLSSAGIYSLAKGPWTGSLGNNSDEIDLVNRDGRLLNTVTYGDDNDWPVGPDGSGFSLAKAALNTDSSAPASWITSKQLNGTPGAANFPGGVSSAGIVLNEVSPASTTNFWLEIANNSTSSYQLGGASIVDPSGSGTSYVFPTQTLDPGQYLSLTQAQLGFSAADGDKLFFYAANRSALLDARSVTNKLRGLAAGHGSDWLYPSAATPGAVNTFNFHNDVVINEIQYHGLPQIPQPTTTQTKLVAIDATTLWRYDQNHASLPAGWASTAHAVDNTNWFSGPALLAYETDPTVLPERTTLNNPLTTPPYVVTTYFETNFTFNGTLSSVTQLMLGHVVDDGAIFYLNGVEVLRYNMPSGTVTSSTFASSNIESSYQGPVTISTAALKVGLNRLSVEVHQSGTNSTDIVFGAELFATTVTAPVSTTVVDSTEEWIELFNKTNSPIDLTDWSLGDAVEYNFTPGTTIAANGYLVVANDAGDVHARYPSISVVGNFTGKLSNTDDNIELIAPDENIADQVHYYDGGYWPTLADGGGSSLELKSPNADNSNADAWGASKESTAGTWENYTTTVVAAPDTGPTGFWNEFLFGMLDAGEALIDNVSVIANPGTASATQLIQNGSFQSDAIGATPATWRPIGNQHATVVVDPSNPTNRVMDLRATGATYHEGNNLGTTFANNTAIVNGTIYQISFSARWVGGSNQLNARAYLSRFQQTFVLDIPQNTGTPGAQNSDYVSNIGPTYTGLSNSPVIPIAGQSDTVSIDAADSEGVASMTLFWALDGGAWHTVPMTLSGGVYSGVIPGQSTAGAVVQFYVQGQDSLGTTSMYPAAGPNSRALYQVNDGFAPSTAIDNLRLIMLTSDATHLIDVTNAMNNEDVGATFVDNNSEVYYDVGASLKGSSFSRLDLTSVDGSTTPYGGSFQVQFHPDHLFRGVQAEVALDVSGEATPVTGHGQSEEIIKQILNHAEGGLASQYDDLAYVNAPNGEHTEMILELARYDSEYLDESYPDGSDGTEFEYELTYYQKQTIDGNPQSAKTYVPTTESQVGTPLTNLGDSKEDYRWNFLIKNHRDDDDYSAIIAMNKAFSLTGTSFLNTVTPLIDVNEWLRTFAVANLVGVADTFATTGASHNTVFYVRPSDGKVLMLPWDWDYDFRQSNTVSLALNSSVSALIANPGNAHEYYGDLYDIIQTTFNSTYLTTWSNYLSGLANENWSTYLSYMKTRSTNFTNKLNSTIPSVAFAITTNGGNSITTSAATQTLAGNGWINVKSIKLSTGQVLPITWTSVNQWQVTVPLSQGVNNITLQAYDFEGALLTSKSITITSTSTIPQPKDNLRITELMYHPSATPAGISTDAEDYEFIEVQNIGTSTLDLTGVQFTVGVTYTFPSETLAAGAYKVIVHNSAAFNSRYTNITTTTADQYTGKLDNSGEPVTMVDANGTTILSFTYNDNWYSSTDGSGHSLVIANPSAATSAWGLQSGWRASTNSQGSPDALDPGAVVGQHVFYNNSSFDGNDPTANAADDAAIALDKQALLPGQTASFSNYSSYIRGINGIMIDLAGLAATPIAADFDFKVGNDNNPANWASAPAPIFISRRSMTGFDRITVLWPDNAIENQWLQVTVKSDADTNLSQANVIYFGNAIGDTGNAANQAIVNADDQTLAQNNTTSPAAINNPYDFNRDGVVDSNDSTLAGSNGTTILDALDLITPGSLQSAAGSINLDTAPQQVDYTFSGGVPAGISIASLVLQNITTGQIVSPAAMNLGGTGNIAQFIFPGSPSGLSDGGYYAELAGSGGFGFTVLTADANHDGTVDSQDFDAIANNFGKSGMTYPQGDFNYDGIVNALDFNALATHYGGQQSAPVPAALPAESALSLSAASTRADLFATKPIGQPDDLNDLLTTLG